MDAKIKFAQIWDADGSFLAGGEMSRATFTTLVKKFGGSVDDAKALWDSATPYSLSDYLGSVKAQVRETETEI
jgi:hypothetical protein